MITKNQKNHLDVQVEISSDFVTGLPTSINDLFKSIATTWQSWPLIKKGLYPTDPILV